MKSINKISIAVLKVLELVHWLLGISMIAVFISSLSGAAWIKNLLGATMSETDPSLTTYGFEVSVIDGQGMLNLKAAALFALGAVFILALMAMIFRNAYLIIKKSNNTTPFQKDNVRMVREIGIFSIAIPVIALIMTCVIHLAMGDIETSVRFGGVVTGILALALTNTFAYGMELQNDEDGLI